MNQDTPPLERLQDLLRELLQLDLADLDFGIYRLLRIKHDEVTAFLEEQLPSAVDEAFASATDAERTAVLNEVETLAAQLRDDIAEDALNADGSVAEEYRDVKAKAIRELVDEYEAARTRLDSIRTTDAQKTEVFNHLYDFFRRYYEDGDFIPKRRYGAREHYAIPYNGEETLLHWANRGQHYVKNAEVFKDYAFTVEGDLVAEPARVRFVLTEASTPPGDTKGDTRYFFPQPDSIEWDQDSRTLVLPFEYRLPSEAEAQRFGRTRVQETILDDSLDELRETIADVALRAALIPEVNEDDDDTEPLLLVRHLRKFVRRNTADYFIHRDLQGFLERELEFYIKDQVLHLADLDGDVQNRLRMLRVFRAIGGQVIAFLAQIEDVQRRLFEKRKFVLDKNYLIQASAVSEEVWPSILENGEQLAEWQRLYGIDPSRIVASDGQVDADFLHQHPALVIDTALFGEEATDRMLSSFDDLDEVTGGILIHGDNYQALRLLQARFRARIKCVYIDPPYNTGSDGFLYKDRYQHSSWLTMMEDRLRLGHDLLANNGAFFASIDDNEQHRLTHVVQRVFGEDHFVTSLVARTNPRGRTLDPYIAKTHEYVALAVKTLVPSAVGEVPKTPEALKQYDKEDEEGRYRELELRNRNPVFGRHNRPNLFYPLYVDPDSESVALEKDNVHTVEVLPLNSKGEEGCWTWSKAKVEEERDLLVGRQVRTGAWRVYRKDYIPPGGATTMAKSIWAEKAINHENGKEELGRLFGKAPYDYPKSVELIKKCIRLGANVEDPGYVLDYFAGSGTTLQAAIEADREDGVRRPFILVDSSPLFDTVIVGRAKRVLYSPEWSEGTPSRACTPQEASRTPKVVEVLRIESYDDALHNLSSEATMARAALREGAMRSVHGDDTYRLRYVARSSEAANASTLNLESLEHPFRYELEILTDNGPDLQSVDLVETFNLLYGLRVRRIQTWDNEQEDRTYKAVIGDDPDGQHTLVLWRDMEDLDPAVERTFLEQRISEADPPYDVVLINGDSTVPGVRSLDPIFKARMMEGESS